MANNILDIIVENKKQEVKSQRLKLTISELEKDIDDLTSRINIKEILKNSSTGIIAEFKRKSPSKGWIFENAKVEDVVSSYSENGATAISILTDSNFFGGTFDDFKKAKSLSKTPLLRKDFMVDEYQIYQAKYMQADIILLIASALTINETKQFARKAKELGLNVLLEIHNEKELDYINDFIDVVGVNNRNLSTFVTDVKISFDLSNKIPNEFLKISESGISDPQTVLDLRSVGYRGFLMGENFMKTNNPGKALSEFIELLS